MSQCVCLCCRIQITRMWTWSHPYISPQNIFICINSYQHYKPTARVFPDRQIFFRAPYTRNSQPWQKRKPIVTTDPCHAFLTYTNLMNDRHVKNHFSGHLNANNLKNSFQILNSFLLYLFKLLLSPSSPQFYEHLETHLFLLSSSGQIPWNWIWPEKIIHYSLFTFIHSWLLIHLLYFFIFILVYQISNIFCDVNYLTSASNFFSHHYALQIFLKSPHFILLITIQCIHCILWCAHFKSSSDHLVFHFIQYNSLINLFKLSCIHSISMRNKLNLD